MHSEDGMRIPISLEIGQAHRNIEFILRKPEQVLQARIKHLL